MSESEKPPDSPMNPLWSWVPDDGKLLSAVKRVMDGGVPVLHILDQQWWDQAALA